MNFTDFYQPGKLGISFEIYPPKTPEGITHLFSALQELKTFNPAFISVTYGAMGTTRNLTGDLALRIQRELGLTTAFHFTCVGSDRDEIKSYVQHLKQAGLSLVVALRGDPPQGIKNFRPPADGFRHANELVKFLREINGFSIAVAGYPEGHIEAPNRDIDLQNLKRKVAAGADVVLTQLFFDNQDFFDFVERCRATGITKPIIPGIMPILNLQQVTKIAGMCGAKISPDLQKKLQKHADDGDAMREIGIEHAARQCEGLIKNGVPGMHFYILNKAYSVGKILTSLVKR